MRAQIMLSSARTPAVRWLAGLPMLFAVPAFAQQLPNPIPLITQNRKIYLIFNNEFEVRQEPP